MASHLYSAAFILITCAMAFLFGPLGFLPCIFYLVKTEQSSAPCNAEILNNKAFPSLGPILLVCVMIAIASWYSIKASFDQRDVFYFFISLSDRVIWPTGAAKYLNNSNPNFSRSFFEDHAAFNAFGIQVCSILALALVSFALMRTKEKCTKIIADLKTLFGNRERLNAGKFAAGTFLLFAMFVATNLFAYMSHYTVTGPGSSTSFLSNVAMAVIYALTIMMDVMMICLWNRDKKL
jgi:hypothetical protein